MSVDIKPQKIRNFYALMATFLVVCESMLVLWMIESTSSFEKIIAGFCSVGLMALFLIIIFKIETQDSKLIVNNDNVYHEKEKTDDQLEILMIDLIVKQIKRSLMKKHDLVNLQQVERLQSVIQILTNANASMRLSPNKTDSARILSEIIKQIR